MIAVPLILCDPLLLLRPQRLAGAAFSHRIRNLLRQRAGLANLVLSDKHAALVGQTVLL